ncbi:MAG: nucleotide pyrophosphohydrolase [Lachnospiraceae bacterium]|nr:nucleotide pyrophosphohydrolase [Lachnospiraceae bacterium]
MTEYERLTDIVAKLRSEGGCPWDSAQTHGSLKRHVIEEACEVVAGINRLDRTQDPENLKEELGDLLFQVVIQARIAQEEGLFDMEDVCRAISDKMVRRHPHVFGGAGESGKDISWEGIKQAEKKGKNREEELEYLAEAFEESKELIEKARERKGI